MAVLEILEFPDPRLRTQASPVEEVTEDTRRLIDDGVNHLVLRAPLSLPFPVRFLQGSADVDVPQERAIRLFEHAEGPDLRLLMVKGADHRFSEPRELELLGATVEDVTALT